MRAGQTDEGEIGLTYDEIDACVTAIDAGDTSGVDPECLAQVERMLKDPKSQALVENFRALGVEVEELEDGLEIQGSDTPLEGRVRSFGDHRIAMAFGILGSLPGNEIQIDEPDVVGVSFPGFWELLDELKGNDDDR